MARTRKPRSGRTAGTKSGAKSGGGSTAGSRRTAAGKSSAATETETDAAVEAEASAPDAEDVTTEATSTEAADTGVSGVDADRAVESEKEAESGSADSQAESDETTGEKAASDIYVLDSASMDGPTDTDTAATEEASADTGTVPAEEQAESTVSATPSGLEDAASTDTEEAGADTLRGSEAGTIAAGAMASPDRAPRSTILPLVIGGFVAAAIGAAALLFAALQGWVDLGPGREMAARVSAQGESLAGLRAALESAEGRIAALSDSAADREQVAAELSEAGSRAQAIMDELQALTARTDALDARVADLAMQPIPEAELPAEVVEAYERQFAEMQAALDDRVSELRAGLNAKLAEIEAAQRAASDAEAAAAAAERRAAAQAALASVNGALESGAAYAESLDILREAGGVEVPDTLAGPSETGVPTLSQLQESFRPAARKAVVEATQAAADEGSMDRMTAFLRTQMGVRSLAPREGRDPDAILSRAEAALAKGDLAAAIEEVGALPEIGRAEMAAWTDSAEIRRAALDAAAALAADLSPE